MDIGVMLATVGIVVTAVLLFGVLLAFNKYEERLADAYQPDAE